MRIRIERHDFLALLFVAFCAAPCVRAQSPVPSPSPSPQNLPSHQAEKVPVIRTSSRLVTLDVIATDQYGKFMAGLTGGDFTVLEDGKPQKIAAFAVQIPAATAAKPAPSVTLPPRVYANFTNIKPQVDRPVTVILMDMLNTSGMDQAYGRKEMIRFLGDLPEGYPVALFVLTSKLKMVQGFTGDSGTLLAAAESLLRYQSPFSSSEAQQQQEEIGSTALEESALPSITGTSGSFSAASVAPIGHAIRDALSTEDSFARLQRMDLTLHALNILAQSVAGYPGRKNLIWLSADFPVAFGPELTPQSQVSRQARDLEAEAPPLQETAALLTEARMAVYPIDVRGLVSLGTGIDISVQTSGMGAGALQDEVGRAYARQTIALWDAHDAMADVARETGGHAFYGTNDLKDAMTRSVEQGSSYYTLAYAPANHDWSGKYRKIEVKTPIRGTSLNYRRGYYSFPEREFREDRAAIAMSAAMQPSLPDFTGLLLKVQVLPPDAEHGSVRIDYAVDAHDIRFTKEADQRQHASIDFVTGAWDKNLKLAGRVAGGMDTTLRPEAYRQVMQTGLPFHQDLELKPGTYTLRLGVLDRGSHKIGSVEATVTVPEKKAAEVSQGSEAK